MRNSHNFEKRAPRPNAEESRAVEMLGGLILIAIGIVIGFWGAYLCGLV